MKRIMKIFVNLLTISRIIFSIYLLINTNKISDITFLTLVAVLFFTDSLDGILARKFNVQTLFGAVMDFVADKILCITLIFPFILERSDSNLGFLLLLGELLIVFTNVIASLNKKRVFVSMIGKIKMWLLSITIIIGYIYRFGYISPIVFNICSIITFIVQILVAGKYMKNIGDKNLLKKSRDYKNDLKNLFNTEYFLSIQAANKDK